MKLCLSKICLLIYWKIEIIDTVFIQVMNIWINTQKYQQKAYFHLPCRQFSFSFLISLNGMHFKVNNDEFHFDVMITCLILRMTSRQWTHLVARTWFAQMISPTPSSVLALASLSVYRLEMPAWAANPFALIVEALHQYLLREDLMHSDLE